MKKIPKKTVKPSLDHRNAVLRHQSNVGAMSLALMAERDLKKEDVSNSRAISALSNPRTYRNFATSYDHNKKTTAELALRIRKKMFPLKK